MSTHTPTTLDSPVLYRALEFNRASVKEDDRTIELSLSSEIPCERWFGDEILSHREGAIRLDRLKNAGPCLWNHDRERHLGRIIDARVRDKRLVIKVKFSRSPFAEEKWQDVKDGILVESSVGYIVHKYEINEDTGTYTAIDWEPMEGSLCPLPADYSVGIGRQQDSETFTAQLTRTHSMETAPDNQQPGQPRRMTRTQEADHARKIREFYDALRNETWKAKAAQVGELCIVQGKTFDEFRAEALPHFTSGAFIDADVPSGGNGHHFRGNMGGMSNRSVGAQIVAHRDVQQLFRGGKKSISFEIPGVANIRSLGTGDFGGSVQHQGAPVFENQRLTIADLIASGTTQSGTVRYPREESFTPGATSVGEAGNKPEQAFDVSPIDAPARKIAAWTRISTELLQDAPAAAAYINSRLEFAVLREEERQILFGDGVGSNLTGIFTNAGVQRQPKGADTAPDAIRKAIGNVAINSDFEASGIVLHPLDWQNIELLKDLDGNYLVGNIFVIGEMGQMVKAPTLWGKPVVVTKSVPAGTALVGDFARAAQLFRRTGLLIEMSNTDGDNLTRNLVTVLAELRALVATYQPNAFCDVTDL